MVSGSYPPEICGVGDYAKNVLNTDRAKDWGLYRRTDWRLRRFVRIVREIRSRAPSQIFMQYPTQGYGWSLVPHLLCIYFSLLTKIRFTVVLHEFSQLSRKANLAARVLLLSADEVLFTNDHERSTAVAIARRLEKRSRTVKIASNIPVSKREEGDRPVDLACFGHIRPLKGLESFLSVVRVLRHSDTPLRIALIGQCPPEFGSYASAVVDDCKSLGIELHLDLPSDTVSDLLAQVKVVCLPFPDGISERRGTAFAAMANGALVVTTVGAHTPAEISAATALVPLCASPERIAAEVHRLLELTPAAQERLRTLARAYLSENIPTSWETVAAGYLAAPRPVGSAP